ncbi:MAG: gliding motility-associated C-terminal domain-containing protein [Chitinophagales bacterium]
MKMLKNAKAKLQIGFFFLIFCYAQTPILAQECVELLGLVSFSENEIRVTEIEGTTGDQTFLANSSSTSTISTAQGIATADAENQLFTYIQFSNIADLKNVNTQTGNLISSTSTNTEGLSELQYDCENENLYALNEISPTSVQLVRFDDETSTQNLISGFIAVDDGMIAGSSTIDVLGNVFYFITVNGAAYNLHSVNVNSGASNTTLLSFEPADIDFDFQNNQLIAIATNGDLFAIDGTDLTNQNLIGTTGIPNTSVITLGNAALDPFAGVYYVTASSATNANELYSIDILDASVINAMVMPFPISSFTSAIPCESVPDFDFESTCLGDIIQFNDLSVGASSWTWDFGDPTNPNNTSTDQNPTHFYTEAGIYDITLDIGGCIGTSQITKQVEIIQTPPLQLPDSLSTCTSILLDAGSIPDAEYLWLTGASTQTIEASVETWYWVDITLGGCTVRDSVYVSITNTLDGNGIFEEEIVEACENEIVVLSVDFLDATYAWSTNETTESIDVENAGVYSVTITAGICEIIDTIEVQFSLEPIFDLGDPEISECGNSYTFNTQLENVEHLWSTGATTQEITIFASGEYWVEVTQGACIARDTVLLDLISFSPANLGPDTLKVCETEALTLDATTNGATYSWSTGDVSPTIDVEKAEAGIYWVDIRVSDCETRDSIFVVFVPALNIDLGEDIGICEGETAMLTTGLHDGIYVWSTGETTDTIFVNASGQYSVLVYNGGCVNTDTINVTLNFPPEIGLTETQDFCPLLTQSFVLEVENNPSYMYEWSNGDSGAAIDVFAAGTYTVSVSNTDGCRTEATTTVTEVCEAAIKFPNAFSPNEDGANDEFRAIARFVNGYDMKIYNRWGEEMFATTTLSEGWNGRYKGKDAPMGVYVWWATFTDEEGKTVLKQGNLTLVR